MARSFATGVLAVLLSAGMALATTTKFTEWQKTAAEPGDVDGAATLNYEASRDVTHYTVVLHNLTPGQTYTVFAGSGSSGQGAFEPATANNGGNLTLTGDTAGDVTAEGQVFLLVGSELRAFAFAN